MFKKKCPNCKQFIPFSDLRKMSKGLKIVPSKCRFCKTDITWDPLPFFISNLLTYVLGAMIILNFIDYFFLHIYFIKRYGGQIPSFLLIILFIIWGIATFKNRLINNIKM
jgi:hypothetical protein